MMQEIRGADLPRLSQVSGAVMNQEQPCANGQPPIPSTSNPSRPTRDANPPSSRDRSSPQAASPGHASAEQSQHDGRGRFTANNKGGPGNPFARRTAALRQAMLDAVTPEDLQAIVRQLIQQAREGDVPAARLVFSYTLGKPDKAVDPDTLDQQEWQQFRQNAVPNQELLLLVQLLQAPLACSILRAALPHLQQQLAQTLAQQLNQPPEDCNPEPNQTTEATPEQPPQPAPRQEEPRGNRAEQSQTPKPATREQLAPDCLAAGEFLADRAFLTEEEAGWLAFLQEVAAQSAAGQPACHDQQGPTLSSLPPPPSANGLFGGGGCQRAPEEE